MFGLVTLLYESLGVLFALSMSTKGPRLQLGFIGSGTRRIGHAHARPKADISPLGLISNEQESAE